MLNNMIMEETMSECESSVEIIHFENNYQYEEQWHPNASDNDSCLPSLIDLSYLYNSLHREIALSFTIEELHQTKLNIIPILYVKDKQINLQTKRQYKKSNSSREALNKHMIYSRQYRLKRKQYEEEMIKRIDKLVKMNEKLKKTRTNLIRKRASLCKIINLRLKITAC